jgi:glutamate-1-semialdehyde 2,1-aminomutase
MATSWSKSVQEHERACRAIPGGVNSPARAFGAVGGRPIFIAEGFGARIVDIDGNEYLDYVGSWGPLILGHAHPAVIEAIRHAIAKGTSFGAPTRLETELAEAIVAAVPGVELVRMTNSGTEAAMSAIRLARGYTSRDLVVKFAGCYHGHVDGLLVQAGSAATTLGVPSSPGVATGCARDTLSLPFNNSQAVEDAFMKRGGEIAAIIVEPIAANMGVVRPQPGFLETLRALSAKHGALLIFDEVITGFRLAFGGAQQIVGVQPDLTILGKIVGGGMPVGAYGGKREIMTRVSPSGPVFQAGTLSGNPAAMAAGLATLRQLQTNPPYERLERLGRRLATGLQRAAEDAGIPHWVAQVGSLVTLFFHPGPVNDYEAVTRSDTKQFARFFWKMVEQGVYLPCSQFEAWFISTAHTDQEIDATVQAARTALAQLH